MEHLTAQEEERLITELRHNPQAFRPLYREYHPRIFAYVAYRVGQKQDAEDIVGDVFRRVIDKVHQFEYRGDGSFSAWIFRIAQNEVNRFHKKKPAELSIDDVPTIQSPALSVEVAVQRKEDFLFVQQLIQTLSPRRQEIIRLKFFGELRNTEIAAVLGLDERTVASHLSRALDDLRQRYELEQKGVKFS